MAQHEETRRDGTIMAGFNGPLMLKDLGADMGRRMCGLPTGNENEEKGED